MRTKGMGRGMPNAYLLGNDIGDDDDSSQAPGERFKAEIGQQGDEIEWLHAEIEWQGAEIEWQGAEIGRLRAEIGRLSEALTSLRNTVGLFYDAGFADGQAANGQAANGQAAPKKTYRHLKALNVAVIVCLAVNMLLSNKLLSAPTPVMTSSISWEHHPHRVHRHRHGHTVKVALEPTAGKRRRRLDASAALSLQGCGSVPVADDLCELPGLGPREVDRPLAHPDGHHAV